MRLSRTIVSLAASLLLTASSIAAQAPQNPSTLQVTSRLVTLDVVVLDRTGKPVTNLDRSKFTIYEDSVPQTIKNFDPPTGHAMPAGSATQAVVHSAADLPRIGTAPVNILVFDEVNTPFHQLAYARQMMEKYLKSLPEVLPVPTLFVAAGASRIAVLHDYTQNRADLLESVQKHTADLDFTQLMASLNGGASGADNGMVKTLGALSQIAESVHGVPARKNVIWIGAGYNRAMDLTNMSESDHDRVLASIKQVTDKMLSDRVTLYVIDPAGPAAAPEITDQSIDPNQVSTAATNTGDFGDNLGFYNLAKETGGRVLTGRNDLGMQVSQATTEGSEYYSLAYVPTSANDAARPYRKIRIAVSEPGLQVIARDGYFGGQAVVSAVALTKKTRQPADVRFDLLNAARTTMAYTGLHMQAQRTRDGYTLLVNANDLKFNDQADGTRIAEVTVVAVCYNAKSKETSQKAAELKEQLEATDQIGPQSRVGFSFPMIVPAFTSRVRFVMRDAGTAYLGTTDGKP
ncbi:MAG TPA: VWA domain-containing protein [Acidobacteriaceae bacterium]